METEGRKSFGKCLVFSPIKKSLIKGVCVSRRCKVLQRQRKVLIIFSPLRVSKEHNGNATQSKSDLNQFHFSFKVQLDVLHALRVRDFCVSLYSRTQVGGGSESNSQKFTQVAESGSNLFHRKKGVYSASSKMLLNDPSTVMIVTLFSLTKSSTST